MKNIIIFILVITVFALGGWIVYDKSQPKASAPSGTSTTSQTESQPNAGNTLDYSGKGLTSVGPDIYNQTTATTLLLSNNNIKTLPSQMGKMTNLRVLKLDHNLLDGSLLGEVRLMPLTTLDVSYNNMTGMPVEIGQLNQLVTLNYSHNKITSLPNELANLKNNLKTFDLTGNPLSQSTIDNLKAELPNTNIIF